MEFYKTKDSSLLNNSKGDTVRPQTDVFLNVTSTPNTPVLVSIYDKSLSLLADFCDSGKQSGVSVAPELYVHGSPYTHILHSTAYSCTKKACIGTSIVTI